MIAIRESLKVPEILWSVCAKAKSPGLVWAVWWGSNTQSVALDTIFSSAGKKGMGFRCILAGALGFQTESVVPAPRPRTAQGVWAVALFPWQVGTHAPLPVAVHPPRICRWELQSSRTCEWLKTRSLDLRNHCSSFSIFKATPKTEEEGSRTSCSV